jgi:hypothetical protein
MFYSIPSTKKNVNFLLLPTEPLLWLSPYEILEIEIDVYRTFGKFLSLLFCEICSTYQFGLQSFLHASALTLAQLDQKFKLTQTGITRIFLLEGLEFILSFLLNLRGCQLMIWDCLYWMSTCTKHSLQRERTKTDAGRAARLVFIWSQRSSSSLGCRCSTVPGSSPRCILAVEFYKNPLHP